MALSNRPNAELLPFESEIRHKIREVERESTAKYEADKQEYDHALQRRSQVLGQEQLRHLNLRILFLVEEKDNLELKIETRDSRIRKLSDKVAELEREKDVAEENLETEKVKLGAKIRENELQKVELDSLHNVASDSKRVLSDKLSLEREMASLKAEIDHLRSQADSHKSLLSEKLTLERQLKTVQVELQSEHRSNEGIRLKTHELQQEAKQFASQIGRLNSEVAKLKSEVDQGQRKHEKTELETQKTIGDWQSKHALMESRVDAFRSKLRISQEQLKATQADLQNAQKNTMIGSSMHSATTAYKRALDADSEIGTPGALPGRKKVDRGSTLPGDKSTFSTTPYLNRATSVTLDDAVLGTDSGGNEDEIAAPHQPLDNQGQVTKLAKINSRAPPKRNVKIASSLEKVNEREEDGEEVVTGQMSKGGTVGTSSDAFDNGDRKKKRRKLFGADHTKTLFDDDDIAKGEGVQERPAFGPPKSRSRIALAPSKGSFGSISPLKKNKRAATDQE